MSLDKTAEASINNDQLAFVIANASNTIWFLPSGLAFVCLALLFWPAAERKPSGPDGKSGLYTGIILALGAVLIAVAFSLLALNHVAALKLNIPTLILALLLPLTGRKLDKGVRW